CLFQSYLWVNYLMRPNSAGGMQVFAPGNDTWAYGLAAVLTMTAGTIFLMWLGEQIDEYGIGNGISLIIMAGILARIPAATGTLLFDKTTHSIKASVYTLGGGAGQDISFEKLVVLVFLFIAVVVAVVAITMG